jgi:hypothetical protein
LFLAVKMQHRLCPLKVVRGGAKKNNVRRCCQKPYFFTSEKAVNVKVGELDVPVPAWNTSLFASGVALVAVPVAFMITEPVYSVFAAMLDFISI